METPGVKVNRALAALLRDVADESFISQTELSRRANISQSQISKLFRFERSMTVTQLVDICEALGVSPAAVLAEAQASAG